MAFWLTGQAYVLVALDDFGFAGSSSVIGWQSHTHFVVPPSRRRLFFLDRTLQGVTLHVDTTNDETGPAFTALGCRDERWTLWGMARFKQAFEHPTKSDEPSIQYSLRVAEGVHNEVDW